MELNVVVGPLFLRGGLVATKGDRCVLLVSLDVLVGLRPMLLAILHWIPPFRDPARTVRPQDVPIVTFLPSSLAKAARECNPRGP